MKILSFEIQNYKNHKLSIIQNCADFHAFIGRNSGGKTSIFEGLRIAKQWNSALNARELAFAGIEEFETKEIVETISISIPETLRRIYLDYYLNLNEGRVGELLETNLLKKVELTFSITTAGDKVSAFEFHNRVVLKSVQISNRAGNLFSILEWIPNAVRLNFIRHEASRSDPSADAIEEFINGHFERTQFGPPNLLPNIGESLQYRILADFQSNLNFIEAIRESTKSSGTQYVMDSAQVSERGSNLVNLVDTMYTNNRRRFDEIAEVCKRIFPDIEDIHPQRMPDNSIRIVVKKFNLPREIDLAKEGSGLDQLLIIIWRIAAARKGTIWLLDEPELHLHPGAQKLLYDFLRDECQHGKQIFVATHSMVFISQSSLDEVSLLLDEKGEARVVSLQDLIKAEERNTSEGQDSARKHIYEALGYDPTLSMEPKTVVMVEGIADGNILKAFSDTLGCPISLRSTKFIPFGNKDKVKNFSPILAYSVAGKKCVIVLDNDNEDPEQIRNGIIQMANQYSKDLKIEKEYLAKDSFIPYPKGVYSIEHYLFEPEAIAKAGKSTDAEILEQLKQEIARSMQNIVEGKEKPKEALRTVWERRFGPYHEVNTPTEIAKLISSDHLKKYPILSDIIAMINSDNFKKNK